MSRVSFAQGVVSSRFDAKNENSLAYAMAASNSASQCRGVLEAIGSVAIADSSSNDLLFDWDRKRLNGSVFALIGLELPGGRGGAVSVAASPQPDGSCAVLAERIYSASQNCKEIVKRELVGYAETRLLPHMSVYVSPKEQGSSISLVDSMGGCLVIRRYVNFNARPPQPGAGK